MMVEEEFEGVGGVGGSGGDCRFPNVRKTFWRSATWSSLSAPPSPKIPNFAEAAALLDPKDVCNPPFHHNSKVRASLPPLQPLAITRRSLEEWPRAGWDDVADWTNPSTPGHRKIKNGMEIKLDLSSVQRNAIEPTEIQLKRDKFAFFDKECSRVAEHIYLGSDAVARNREILRANGITHVLNCVGFVCPEYFKKDLTYKTLWLQDSPCEDITSLLYDVFDYFEEVREQVGRVLVHCYQGVSRSTSLVIAYLMWRQGRSFEDAFQDVKAARGVTNPNMGFACQLLQCQKRVHAAPLSPTSVLRMYRLAPHSPYDPLHLVPKTVNQPGPAALDSRGAFVVHVPHAIYVWVGRSCDKRIAHAAQGAAGQVVRYERAQGPITPLFEGEEVSEFWEALSKCSFSSQDNETEGPEASVQDMDVGDKECDLQEYQRSDKWRVGKEEVEMICRLPLGNKRVASYDVDFELFHRASQGGVVPPVQSSGVGAAAVPTRVPAREDGWSLLRRKFRGRELVAAAKTSGNMSLLETNPPMESVIVDEQETNIPSPDPSMCSSSPHFSPFSISSGLSDASASTSSPFASPTFPSPSLERSSRLLQSSPPASSHNKSFHFPLEQPKTLLVLKPVPQLGRKSPSISLAQRRGNASPSLSLPALVDDPPPAPRGMSRKPRLPPILTIEKNKTELGAEENGDLGFRFDGLDELCSGLVDDANDHVMQDRDPTESDPQASIANVDAEALELQRRSLSEPAHGTGLPVLFEWPRMEKIEMFDADDLDTRSVFLLVAPDTRNLDNMQGQVVYVWIGSNVIAHKERDWNGSNEVNWRELGYEFLERMHMSRDIPVRVVRERLEPDGFWENFSHG